MFVVVRRGVYDRGVVAVEDRIAEAFVQAEYWAGEESDLYHSFEIRSKGEHGEYDEVLYSYATWNPRTREDAKGRVWHKIADEYRGWVWDNA